MSISTNVTGHRHKTDLKLKSTEYKYYNETKSLILSFYFALDSPVVVFIRERPAILDKTSFEKFSSFCIIMVNL